ncbi:hypothetical protein ACWDNR_24790, partial [Gordonia aichiensis]
MTTGRRAPATTPRQWRVLVPVVVAALAGVALAWLLRRDGGFPLAACARVLANPPAEGDDLEAPPLTLNPA